MRKITNLALVAALAVPAFASTAAAQQACEPGEDMALVSKKESYETVADGPPPGFYYGVDVMAADRGDLTISMAWESTSDWDLSVYVNGEEEVASSEDSQLEGAESVETVVIEKVKACTYYEIRVLSFVGVPLEAITVTASYE